MKNSPTGGWQVGQEIGIELDTVFSALLGSFLPRGLPSGFAELIQGVPPDWRAALPEMIGEKRGFVSLMETCAWLAGEWPGDDYQKMSLEIRALSAGEVVERLVAEGWNGAGASPAERLAAQITALKLAAFQQAGFPVGPEHPQIQADRRTARQAARILKGGDLHTAFWHWLDRFYYGSYAPWRQGMVPELEKRAQRVTTALGGSAGDRPPEMGWLSPRNPLLRRTELNQAVRAGQVRVFFWIEPFGLADSWSYWPGWVLSACAEAGELYASFQNQAEDVARRVQALADPTRLIILRIIRHFGMINTEIADYLGLARPTVSVHAKILREAGLIHSRKEGREMRHEIDAQAVRALFDELDKFLDLPEVELGET